MTTFNNSVSTFGSAVDAIRTARAKTKMAACMKHAQRAFSSYACVTIQEEPFRMDLIISPFCRQHAAILTEGGMLEGQMLLCNEVPFNLMNWTQFSAYSDYYPGLDVRIGAAAKEHGITTAVVHRVMGRDEWLMLPGLDCITHWEFMNRFAPGRSWMIGWPTILVDLKYANGYEMPRGATGAQFHL